MVRGAVLLPLLAIVVGCGSSTPIELASAPADVIEKRNVVLACTVTSAKSRANLTFAENHLQPFPAQPSQGWVTDVSLRVDAVLKGTYGEASLRITDAQTPDDRDTMLPFTIRMNERVTVAFNRGLFGAPGHFMAVVEPLRRQHPATAVATFAATHGG